LEVERDRSGVVEFVEAVVWLSFASRRRIELVENVGVREKEARAEA
jgi:hypothetical protein